MRRTRVRRLQTSQRDGGDLRRRSRECNQLRKIPDEGSDKLPRIVTPIEKTRFGACVSHLANSVVLETLLGSSNIT